MASRFAERFEQLARPAMMREFGVDVVYSNGIGTVSTTALVSGTQYDQSDGMTLTRHEYVDFLIPVSALVIGGSSVTPTRQHTITWNSKTYKVTSPQGEDVFGYDDENQLILRVHTILTATS